MSNDAALFPRNFHKSVPIAVRGEGSWIYSADGRKFLDAAGQAAVINIGHGVPELAMRWPSNPRNLHSLTLRNFILRQRKSLRLASSRWLRQIFEKAAAFTSRRVAP